MRPLVNSHATTNTKLSLNLIMAFKALRPELDLIYNTAYAAAGLGASPTRRSWWIADSAEACHIINKYNTCDRNENHWRALARHPYMQTGDFEQLYTSLPHDDLITKTRSVIQEAFSARKPPPQGKVIVLKFKDNVATWKHITHNEAGKRNGKEFFTIDMMMDATTVIVENTFFAFGGNIYRQQIGIPMGTNCAGYLAIYLYAYELKFIRQLALACTSIGRLDSITDRAHHTNARKILTAFTFTMRYIDDVHCIHNPYLPHLTYDSQIHQGFHGVYPDCLNLALEDEATSVNFLDLNIHMGINTTITGTAKYVIRTALFDKRQTDVFKGFVFNRFPHITSALTDRAKLGIVVSQFHRFRMIISDYHVFISEMSRVIYAMMNRGYTRRSLVRKFRGVLPMWPNLYHVQHGRRSSNNKVILDVTSSLDALLCSIDP